MPLSISNSNHRLPRENYLKLWIAAVSIAGLVLGGLELFWRQAGWEPSVADTVDWWCVHRDKVYDQKVIVLLGASHMMSGVVPGVLASRFPGYTVANLSRTGEPPIASLRDLADDARFRGIAVVDMVSFFFETNSWEAQSAVVDYYNREFSLNRKLNSLWASWLGSRFVILNPELGLSPVGNFLVPFLRDRRLPMQSKVFGPDRALLIDYGNVGDLTDFKVEKLSGYRPLLHKYSSEPAAWMEHAREIGRIISRIQDRGGEVVVVHFPHSGELYAFENEIYPRSQYWDVLEDSATFPMIHFEDYPGMCELECPDFTHLGKEDARRMSASLADAMLALGVMGDRGRGKLVGNHFFRKTGSGDAKSGSGS